MQKTLLEAMCEIKGFQGGIIHDHADITSPNYFKFLEIYNKYAQSSRWVTKDIINNMAKLASYKGLKW